MFDHIQKKIASRYLKQQHSQEFWYNLYRFSINKMNYGPGSDYNSSGEKEVVNHIKKLYNPSEQLTFFDVGANVGGYTNMVLDCIGNQALVHAFEPSAWTFEKLCSNVKSSQVKLNNIGCSEIIQTLPMYSNKEGSGMASVYNRELEYLGISMKETEQAKFTRIDNYCQENNVGHIHLLKLDIEGHELSALKGAKNMIDGGNIDFIQFEFGGCNIDSRTYFKDFFLLLHDKYDIYRILQNGLYKIDKYSEYLEIFVTVNYLAQLRKD